MTKVAVVTGSNKGIGFAIVKALSQKFDGVVYLTSRDEKRGLEAVAELNKLGLYPEYHQLDVADRSSIEKFRDDISNKHGGIDILINNAAVIDTPYIDNTFEDCGKVIEINFIGLLNMQDIVYPIVKNNGRILNMSSSCGHLSNLRNMYWINKLMDKDLTVNDVKNFVQWFLDSKRNGVFKKEDIVEDASIAAYRISKVAMSALTPIQQKMLEPRNISVNSLHPGLVKTDLTCWCGFFTADEAAETPLYIVLEAPKSLQGQYIWYDKQNVDWTDYKSDHYFKMPEPSVYQKNN